MNLSAQLAQGIAELGLYVPAATQRKLLDYLALIAKWNRVHNLTSLRIPATMVSSHLLDCLATAPHLECHTLLDVGSGAGLPGIPLALIGPHKRVTLLDSNHKKAAFLRQAVIELELKNAEVVCERAETWCPSYQYDLVISRAFSELTEFLRVAGKYCRVHGTVAAMKGAYPHEELARLPQDYRLRRVIPLEIPGLRADRHLVLLTPEH